MPSVGHWSTLTEAEKLTDTVLIGGLVEENVKQGGVLSLLAAAQFTGKSAKWNREKNIPTAAAVDLGTQLTWQEAADIDQLETVLKRVYVQTVLDNFVSETYNNINNYQAIQLLQDKKSMLQKIEDMLWYGDLTYSTGSLEFDGLHALAEASGTNFHSESLDVDMLEAGLSLNTLRQLEDRMRHGVDLWVFPKTIARRLDAYVQENGLSTNTFGQIAFGLDELGKKVTMWNGVPILRSDYLVSEQANTGVGSDARAKNTSGDNQYSVFALKMGQVMQAEPGLTIAFGGDGVSVGSLWKTIFFPNLEDFDAAGLRLISYLALLDGSSMSIGRIYDIEDVAVVV